MNPFLKNTFLLAAVSILFSACVAAQSLSLVSGNGQIVLEQFLTTAPLVVQARDAAGRPAAGVAVTWSITQGAGTLVGQTNTTDANGQASTNFLGTRLPLGLSFQAAVVHASSASGQVDFVVTTTILQLPVGGIAAPPLVELVAPTLESGALIGNAGAILPGAVVVRVTAQSGPQTGIAVPNVGVRILNDQDPAVSPSATCNGPGGMVLTDSTGVARCDLVLNRNPGTVSLRALAGEIQATRNFTLQVNAGPACTYTLSAASQSFGGAGGSGSVNVTTGAGCSWTATGNAPWITISSGSSGSGNGSVAFSVAANTGPARTGTLAIAGQTFTITEGAAGTSNPLAILTSPALPSGFTGVAYSAALNASGGQPPYTWSASGSLPPGLTLNPSTGAISGTPSTAGNFAFSTTVRDTAGAVLSQNFTLNVFSSTGGLVITNSGFPNGVVGQPYQQGLTSAGSTCGTPFTPPPQFSVVSGSLPPGLSVQPISDRAQGIAGTPTTAGTFNFTLAVTDTCGRTATAAFTLTITGAAPPPGTLTATPAALVFSVTAGSATRPADQSISLAAATATAFSATASTTWLTIAGAITGSTPAVITVGVVNTVALAAGTYAGSVVITSPSLSAPITVPVTLTVTAVATLALEPTSLTFSVAPAVLSRQVVAIRSVGGPLHFQASVATGTWLSVSPAEGDAPGTVQVMINSAGLPPGPYTGVVTISAIGASNTPQIIPVTLNVVASAAPAVSPASLSFSYEQGVAPPAAQILSVTSGAPVNFTVSVSTASGGTWLFASPSSGATPASLTVSVNPLGLAPGSYEGTISISTTPALTVRVSLTIVQPVPAIASVTHAATFAPGPVAPGELITVFGTGLGPANPASLRVTPDGVLDNVLAETRVLFDGAPSPLVYTSGGQVSAIVPYAVSGQFVTRVQVEFKGVRSSPTELLVAASMPGIFPGAVVNEDGSLNMQQSGAVPGSIVVFWATGEGVTDPPGVDGRIAGAALPKPVLPVAVLIGGQLAEILYAGAAPAMPAGVLQMNARVPASTARGGSVPLVLTIGDNSSPAVPLAIRPE